MVTRQPFAISCGIILDVPLYRRNKVVNHFSIMVKRRLCDEDEEEEKPGEKKKLKRRLCEEDEGEEKPGEKKKKKIDGSVGNLRIHDLEEEQLEISSDSDCSGGDGKYS